MLVPPLSVVLPMLVFPAEEEVSHGNTSILGNCCSYQLHFKNLAKEEVVGNFVPPSSYPSNDLSPLRCSLLGIYSTADSEIGIGIPVEEPVHVFSLENKKLKFLSPAPIGQTIDDGSNDRYREVIGSRTTQLEPNDDTPTLSLSPTILFPTAQGFNHKEIIVQGRRGEEGSGSEGEDNAVQRGVNNEISMRKNAEKISFKDILEQVLQNLRDDELLTQITNDEARVSSSRVSSSLTDPVFTQEDEKRMLLENALVSYCFLI
jgi:hypothetical protein